MNVEHESKRGNGDIERLNRLNQNRINRNKILRYTYIVLLGCMDILLIDLSILVSYYVRFHMEFPRGFLARVPIPPLHEYIKALIIVDYVTLILFLLFNLYRRDRAQWFIDEFYKIIKALTISFFLVSALTFFARSAGFEYSRMVFFYSWICSIILVALWRYIILNLERWYHLRGGNINRVMIVGSGDMARIVARKLKEHPELGYRVVGFTSTSKEKLLDLEGFPYLGPLSGFERAIIENEIDEIFISDKELSHFRLLEIVSTCEVLGIYIKMVPTVYDLLIDFADMNDLDGLPLVAVREQPMYELSLLVKRLFDILFASAVLLITAPVCIVVMILIKMDSSGPIIFSQIRAGVGGKPFKMYKFRTMFVDAEQRLNDILNLDQLEEPVFKIKNDPRITRIGRILRRTSLDEIPQFWNVLKGDMSVVGPRPEETQLVDKYNIWQRRRLKIKPGITGLQQVMCRGTTSLTDRVKYDIYYLRKHSLFLDIWIIFKTIPVVISGKGAY